MTVTMLITGQWVFNNLWMQMDSKQLTATVISFAARVLCKARHPRTRASDASSENFSEVRTAATKNPPLRGVLGV